MEAEAGCSKANSDESSADKRKKCKLEPSDVAVEAKMEVEEEGTDECRPGILDLSDDVLLIILKNCTPRDLKALGFSCSRLGRLVCDRSLWVRVDARDRGVGRTQLSWFLEHTISTHTESLALKGFASEAKGCLGTVDAPRPIANESREQAAGASSSAGRPERRESSSQTANGPEPPPMPVFPSRQPCFHFQRNSNPQLPRFSASPAWREEKEESGCGKAREAGGCGGPRWTLTRDILADLCHICPNLTELRLEYANINCNVTPISSFPGTLTILSLRGSRCYNLEINKSYMFRVHDYMPRLKEVDLSECSWMEPSTLLPLSKLPELRVLIAERCRRLTECVAYASLAARYGFRELRVLNMRGSPMGDSEVSGFGWLPQLEELYLEPTESAEMVENHSHYLDDPCVATSELEPWEGEEPDYFRCDAKQPHAECSACSINEPAQLSDPHHNTLTCTVHVPDTNSRSLAVLHYRRYDEEEQRALTRQAIERQRRHLRRRRLLMNRPSAPAAAASPSHMKLRKRSSQHAEQQPTKPNKGSKSTIQNTEKPPKLQRQMDAQDDGPSTSTRSKRSQKPPREGSRTSGRSRASRESSPAAASPPPSKKQKRSGDDNNPGPSTFKISKRTTSKGVVSLDRAAKKTQAKAGTSTSAKSTQAKAGPSTSAKSTQSKAGPSTSAKSTQSKADPSTSAKSTQPKAGPSTSGKSTQPKAGPSTSAKSTQAKAGPSTSGKSTQAKAGPSTSAKKTQAKDDGPSTSGTAKKAKVETHSVGSSVKNFKVPYAASVQRRTRLTKAELLRRLKMFRRRNLRVPRDDENEQVDVEQLEAEQLHVEPLEEENNEAVAPRADVIRNVYRVRANAGVQANPEEERPNPAPQPNNEQNVEDRQRERLAGLRRRILELEERLEGEEDFDEYYGEGRVHVIYVNVRRPRHDVFRMLVQEEEPRAAEGDRFDQAVLNVVDVPRDNGDDARPVPEALRNGPEFAMVEQNRAGVNRGNVMNILRMPFIQNFLYGPAVNSHVSGASLITDAAINRFGRSDNPEVINYVHIGPNGAVRAGIPPAQGSDRPDKSKLRVLVIRGFTGITNRTLVHLVTAAPELRLLDVTGTKITEKDVITFKMLRPDCEVKYTVRED